MKLQISGDIIGQKEGIRMLYDSHMHTTNSDGRSTITEMCQTAIEMGVVRYYGRFQF